MPSPYISIGPLPAIRRVVDKFLRRFLMRTLIERVRRFFVALVPERSLPEGIAVTTDEGAKDQ